MAYQPVVIIGAPRSGTNMLRDMLTELPGVGTWPCDEINYIWRHGNVKYPSDEFTSEMATPKVIGYIRKQFDQIAKKRELDTVIEKTCANSLRVGFVEKVMPDAKYIFIVRDGIDVVGSALVRWHASLDLPYILRKAKYVPALDLPYYASRYFLNQLHRLVSGEKRLASWGPVLAEMETIQANHSLQEVCALQWKACVDNSERDFTIFPQDTLFRIKYEDFVREPVADFARLADFLNKPVPDHLNDYLRNNVRSSSIGKGRKTMNDETIAKLRPLLANTLDKYGYE